MSLRPDGRGIIRGDQAQAVSGSWLLFLVGKVGADGRPAGVTGRATHQERGRGKGQREQRRLQEVELRDEEQWTGEQARADDQGPEKQGRFQESGRFPFNLPRQNANIRGPTSSTAP